MNYFLEGNNNYYNKLMTIKTVKDDKYFMRFNVQWSSN